MKKFKKSLPYFIGIIIFIVTVIVLCMVATRYNYRVEIVAGILAFVGAVTGGAFTLFGVLYTINSNKQREYLNKLPKDIFNLNEALFLITDKLENKLVNKKRQDPKDYNVEGVLIRFFKIPIEYTELHKIPIECTELQEEVTDIYPEELNKLLLSIDMITYRKYLKFRNELKESNNKLKKLEKKVSKLMTEYEVKLKYADSQTNRYKIEGVDEVFPVFEEVNEEKKELMYKLKEFKTKLNQELLNTDEKYMNQIRKIYEELKKSLEVEISDRSKDL